MKVNAHGQITIPAELRNKLGLLPHSEIQLEIVKDGILIRPSISSKKLPEWIQYMAGKGDVNLSTDQILAHTRSEA